MHGYGILSGIGHAWKGLRRAPGFTALAVGTVAIGVGGVATIGGLLGAVLLRPLPYADADRLVTVWQVSDEGDRVNASAPLYRVWHGGLGVFDQVAAYRGPGWTLVTAGPGPERVPSVRVTVDYFRTLGVGPALGRAFTEADAVEDPAAVIVSSALWNRLGMGPTDIGATISLDERARVVIGVMPPGFEFIEPGVDVWWPYRPDAADSWDQWTMKTFARLAPGIDRRRAQATLAERQSSLLTEDPGRDMLPAVSVRSLTDQVVGGVRGGLVAVAVGVVLALLIASVNVGGLLLSRNVTRRPELAMMRALGATRGRVFTRLAAEGAILSGGGVIVGLAVAWALLGATRSVLPADFPRLQEVSLDGYALAAAAVAAVLVTIVTGVLAVPWRDTGLPGRLRPGRSSPRTLDGILALQVAMTVVLLVAGALLGRSFLGLSHRNPGIDPDAVLAIELRLPPSLSDDDAVVRSFVEEVDRAVAAVPGVIAAGQIQRLPFAGGNWSSYVIDPEAPDRDPPAEGDVRVVTPGYMGTVHLPVLRGRGFEEADRDGGQAVVIVNEPFADLMWPGTDPIGRRVIVDMFDSTERLVVGVVGSVRHHGLATDPAPEVYVPYAQAPVAFSTLVARGPTGLRLVDGVRAAVRAVNPSASVSRAIMLDDLVDASIAPERMHAFVFGTLAALALALSGIGVFGAASFRVVQERHQLGLRAALGASSRRLRRRVLGRALSVVGVGLGLGMVASLLMRSVIGSLLYGLAPTDPLTYALVAAVLAALGVAASLLPALQAGRVDPMTVIRDQR